jgi:hypothetical protein
VRRVAGGAAILLDRHMFEGERSRLFLMTLGADFHATIGFTQLRFLETAVRVMAVAAQNQSNIDAMAEWESKVGPLLFMAVITEQQLPFDQQVLPRDGMVRRVATETADALGKMDRLAEIVGLGAGLVTAHAALADLCRRKFGEDDDFGDVAASGHVRAARSVAGLTAMFAVFQQGAVRGVGKAFFIHFRVASLAGIRPNVGGPGGGVWRGPRLGCLLRCGRQVECNQAETEDHPDPYRKPPLMAY